jgi:hypothetical protein
MNLRKRIATVTGIPANQVWRSDIDAFMRKYLDYASRVCASRLRRLPPPDYCSYGASDAEKSIFSHDLWDANLTARRNGLACQGRTAIGPWF